MVVEEMLSVIIFVVTANAALCSSVDRSNSIEISDPRTLDRGFDLVYNLYKTFKSLKNKDAKKFPHTKSEMVPFNGQQHRKNLQRRVDSIEKFPTLTDVNMYDEVMADTNLMNMNVTSKEKPQFWLFDNFAKRTDLIAMTKVFLKLIVLKKIAKFIALTGLLFFIPAITGEEVTSEFKKTDSRDLEFFDRIDYRTKEILNFVIVAFEGFSTDVMVWCVAEHDAFCRFGTMFDRIDQSYNVDYIINMWYPQSSVKILKFLEKMVSPTKPTKSEEEYLKLPHDDDEANFPIEISGEVEQDENNIDEDTIEADDD